MNIATILKQNIAGKLINHGIVFLINIMIVRLLEVSESGFYFNELYLINLVVFFFSAGLDYSAIAWISREPGLAIAVRRKLIQLVLFFIAVVLFFVLIILPQTSFHYIQTSIAIILFSIGNLILILFQGVLTAMKKFNIQNLILVSTNLCFLFYLLFFIKEDKTTIINQVSIGYGVLFFLQGILMIFFSYEKGEKSNPILNWISFFKHGSLIMFSSLIYFCFLRIDNFFVEKYSNAITLSNYIQCGKIGQYFIYFSAVISSTILPFIATDKIATNFIEWKKMMVPYFLIIFSGAFILIFFGQYLYPFIYGNDFSEMNKYMIILLPGYVCLGMLTLVNAIYIGKGNVKKILTGDIIGLTIVFTGDSFLIPDFGVFAAAIISSLSYILVFLYLWIDLKNQFSQPHNFEI